jgi:RNA polymerase sigma factor (sigma-70 family)
MSSDEEVSALFEKEEGRLRAYMMSCGASTELAEDCAQDGFLAAARRWGRLKNPRAYAYTVARHQMYKELKRAAREVPMDRQDEVDNSAGDPSDGLIQRQDEQAVRRALNCMRPSRAKEAIVLRFVDGFRLKETAAIMGISIGTAKRYSYEGLCAIRSMLNKENYEGEGQ